MCIGSFHVSFQKTNLTKRKAFNAKKKSSSFRRNEEPSTQQDSSSSSYFVVCENLPDSKNIKVAGATFLYRTESENYHYWFCLYSDRKPECCKAACRREIGSKDKTKVEFIAPHSTDPQAPCPFMAQASDYEVIQNQVTSGLAKEAVEVKLLNLLKENLGWSIQELKDHCYLNNMISVLSQHLDCKTCFERTKKRTTSEE